MLLKNATFAGQFSNAIGSQCLRNTTAKREKGAPEIGFRSHKTKLRQDQNMFHLPEAGHQISKLYF